MVFLSKKQQSTPRRRMNPTEPSGEARATAEDLKTRYNFRRNRTLTGSLSSDVASANEHRSELRSGRVHTHHLRRHRRHAGMALLMSLLFAAGLGFLLYQAIGTVQVAASVGGSPDRSLYTAKITDYLNRHPGERFRFSLNTAGLASYLQNHDAPEVASVAGDVALNGFTRAEVYLKFRQPVVAWQTGGAHMYVDGEGVAFSRNYYSEPRVQVVDQTGIQAKDNQVLASNRFLGFIGKVVGRMSTHGYEVTDIILPANTTRQIEVKCATVSYPIKFSIDRPVGEQAEDASRSIQYFTQHAVTPQYLDVRVSGRAFYK